LELDIKPSFGDKIQAENSRKNLWWVHTTSVSINNFNFDEFTSIQNSIRIEKHNKFAQ